MEQQIKDRYHEDILLAARQRYSIASDQIKSIDAFESFIYEFQRGPRSYILRINHSLRRSEALIEGEVDWINYLAAGGVSVSQAIRSESGKLVEAIDDGQGGQFLATAFVKAQGRHPWDMWTPALYADFGQLMGRMHAQAEHYQPPREAWRRPDWDDDFVERYLPASEAKALQKYEAQCAHLRTLPKDCRSYGLIHYDAHGGNFLVDEAGRLTMFDFDGCTYSWYANDIAIALGFMSLNGVDTPDLTREFMTHFLRGYRRAYPLDRHWLGEIPAFLKVGEIYLYAVIHRDYDVNHIPDEWAANFMRDRKYMIEHDVPTIDFDFESLADEV
jgi:amicoumacin kinase